MDSNYRKKSIKAITSTIAGIRGEHKAPDPIGDAMKETDITDEMELLEYLSKFYLKRIYEEDKNNFMKSHPDTVLLNIEDHTKYINIFDSSKMEIDLSRKDSYKFLSRVNVEYVCLTGEECVEEINCNSSEQLISIWNHAIDIGAIVPYKYNRKCITGFSIRPTLEDNLYINQIGNAIYNLLQSASVYNSDFLSDEVDYKVTIKEILGTIINENPTFKKACDGKFIYPHVKTIINPNEGNHLVKTVEFYYDGIL